MEKVRLIEVKEDIMSDNDAVASSLSDHAKINSHY